MTQRRNLPPGACFMKPTQSKLLLFAPAATKLLFRSPAPSCYCVRLGVACAFPTLASFGSSCLWLKGSGFAMFQGPVPQSSCAVRAGRESPRSTASPRDHGHPKRTLLAPAMATVCPQDAPISHVPTLEVCSHSAQAILPDSPIDPIP